MLTAVFSLTGALVFGAADFLGGLAAKRVSAILATAVAAISGFVVLLAAYPLLGGAWNAHDVWWGILSPLTAVVSAVVPMIWGLLVTGERLAALGYWALGLALLAVVLVGFVPEKGAVRPSARGVVMAIGSGIAIGGFYITIDQTSDESGVVPLILNRGVNAAIMFTVLGVLAGVTTVRARSRVDREPARIAAMVPAERMPRAEPLVVAPAAPGAGVPLAGVTRRTSATTAGVRLAIACGIVDVVANALLLFGIRAGDLSVAAVLGAMYPAGTILLAAFVLRERIAPVQWVGLVLALAAAGMLAVA